jgi:hypothetical protein
LTRESAATKAGLSEHQLIQDALRAAPERSDRQIARELGVKHDTVGALRRELEGRGQIGHVETRVDTLGRQQPSDRRQPGALLVSSSALRV